MVTDKKDTEARKIVGAILFAIAGLCVVAVIIIILMFPDSLAAGTTVNTPTATTSPQIQYEKVDLQVMLDELNTNALRAEETYQDMYIEVTGEIISFDSDGKYISIKPSGAPVLTDSTMCYLTDPTQKAFLLKKNVGDVVTIRGKVVSIGEVLGYSIDIIEIND